MPRRILRKILPSQATLRDRWFLRPFDALLHDPSLWSTHRRNTTRSLALGIFIAFIPFPVHTVLAGVSAIYLRTNVPVAILASWITNPITFGPLYYGCYRLGLLLSGKQATTDREGFSGIGVGNMLEDIGEPLLLGCLVAGAAISGLCYWSVNRLWVWYVRRRFGRRRSLARKAQS